MSRRSAELRPLLQQAQTNLEHALKEACGLDVRKANTGELIHIDELLAIAGESAKKAISIRRRLKKDPSTTTADQAAPTTESESIVTPSHRLFADASGVQWTTFAVHPLKSTSDRSRLPAPFETGWLSFDSGTETRRLTPIPDGWANLSDDELRSLCGQATVATRRGSRDSRVPRDSPL